MLIFLKIYMFVVYEIFDRQLENRMLYLVVVFFFYKMMILSQYIGYLGNLGKICRYIDKLMFRKC